MATVKCRRCGDKIDKDYVSEVLDLYCEGCYEWMAEAKVEMDGEIEFDKMH